MSRLVFVLPLALSSITLRAQTTVTVPSATYPTIQSAIDGGSAGWLIRVHPGVYKENIDFKGKDLTVESLVGPASTTIDGRAQRPVVLFIGGETRNAVLRGFTITNGLGSSTPTVPGGGVRILSSSPTIQSCHFIANRAPVYGGGIGCSTYGGTSTANPLIEDCYFLNNVAGGPGGAPYASGAGIALADFTSNAMGGKAIVRRCVFWNNVANARGGGVFCLYGNNATIEDNLFQRNQANSGSTYNGGAAIHVSVNSIAVVRNNRIAGNITPAGGGAVKYFNVKDPIFVNNTIVENKGGGIAGYANSGPFGSATSAIVQNNILWNNGAEITVSGVGPPRIAVTYCDVKGGYTGAGNINADPKLANALSGNHRLLAGSPCFNTGNNNAPQLPGKDFEGDTRPIAGTVDIGADEYVPKLLLYSDVASLSLQNGGNIKFTITGGQSGAVYLLLPSLSGVQPGVDIGQIHLPLNIDMVTLALLPFLPGLIGGLNTQGKATPTVPFAGPLPAGLKGETLSFAVLLFSGGGPSDASNDEHVFLVQ